MLVPELRDEIADKAIVCFRCGAGDDRSGAAGPSAVVRRRSRSFVAALIGR